MLSFHLEYFEPVDLVSSNDEDSMPLLSYLFNVSDYADAWTELSGVKFFLAVISSNGNFHPHTQKRTDIIFQAITWLIIKPTVSSYQKQCRPNIKAMIAY